jgi:hypothetical protein
LSENHDSFLRLLKKKDFKEESMTQVALDAVGTSTPLESNKSLFSLGSRTPKITSCPARAQRRPSVPPTFPAPRTPISSMCSFPQAAPCK